MRQSSPQGAALGQARAYRSVQRLSRRNSSSAASPNPATSAALVSTGTSRIRRSSFRPVSLAARSRRYGTSAGTSHSSSQAASIIRRSRAMG